jgi:hypothetical protein
MVIITLIVLVFMGYLIKNVLQGLIRFIGGVK